MTEENNIKRSEKHEQARGMLPDELKPVFDELVGDYRFSATMRHGSPYVSYIVLADLIRVGWRHREEPIKDLQQK